MGIYLPNMEMPKGGYRTIEIGFDADGHPMAICDDRNVYDVIPIPPHGRLIDESVIDLQKYEKAAHDALHNGKGSILYDSGVLAGARAITQLVRRAPTIIPAEEDE